MMLVECYCVKFLIFYCFNSSGVLFICPIHKAIATNLQQSGFGFCALLSLAQEVLDFFLMITAKNQWKKIRG